MRPRPGAFPAMIEEPENGVEAAALPARCNGVAEVTRYGTKAHPSNVKRMQMAEQRFSALTALQRKVAAGEELEEVDLERILVFEALCFLRRPKMKVEGLKILLELHKRRAAKHPTVTARAPKASSRIPRDADDETI